MASEREQELEAELAELRSKLDSLTELFVFRTDQTGGWVVSTALVPFLGAAATVFRSRSEASAELVTCAREARSVWRLGSLKLRPDLPWTVLAENTPDGVMEYAKFDDEASAVRFAVERSLTLKATLTVVGPTGHHRISANSTSLTYDEYIHSDPAHLIAPPPT